MAFRHELDGAGPSCIRNVRYLEVIDWPALVFFVRSVETFKQQQISITYELPLRLQQTCSTTPFKSQTLDDFLRSVRANLARLLQRSSV